MLATLKSEYKKLLTVRSTYILTGVVFALTLFISIYILGYSQGAAPISGATKAGFLEDVIYTVLSTLSLFAAIIGILMVTHEYRYSTIGYTLTASRSRLRVFFSKIIVMLTYVTVVGLFMTVVAYFGAKWGVSLKGIDLAPQSLPLWELTWRFSSYLWISALFGLIIAFLIKNTIGAVVAYLVIPVTVEQLLELLMKDNADFLPFKAVDAIAAGGVFNLSSLTNLTALCVSLVYVVVAGTLAAILFVHRDAN